RADRDGHDAAGTAHFVALFDGLEFAEEHGADVVLLEVQRQSVDVVGELHHLAGHDALQPVDAGDAVADRRDGPDLGHIDAFADAAQLLANNLCDFFCFQIDSHIRYPNDSRNLLILPATEAS